MTGADRQPVVLYGAGGMAREAAWLARSCEIAGRPTDPVAFVVDDEARHGETVNGLPVMSLAGARTSHPTALLVPAVGDPRLRERLVENATAAGFSFASLIHRGAVTSQWVTFGEGTVICRGSTITTNIALGDHVQVNIHCSISHDVVMADFATLAPGVHLSGRVELGRAAYVGVGAVVINGTDEQPIVIGDNAVVGAGAVVTRDVAPGTTVAGVPARPIDR